MIYDQKYLAAVLFTALLAGVVEASSALELSQYNKLETVSRIVNDSEVTDNLRALLGNHYQTFIDNFDVFGEPHTTAGGGLFVEGWLKDLYLENASALVIDPDGKIFAAWWFRSRTLFITSLQIIARLLMPIFSSGLPDLMRCILQRTTNQDYAPAKLVVSKGGHVLVEQSGQWRK